MAPNVVRRDPFSVIGLKLHYEGEESIFQRLWREYGCQWGIFDVVETSEETFGVVTNIEQNPNTFEYVVGVAAESDRNVPDDFVSVDVLGGAYALFETSFAAFESDYETVLTEWLPESQYERRSGPEFERYGPDFDTDAPNPSYEFYLPVESTR